MRRNRSLWWVSICLVSMSAMFGCGSPPPPAQDVPEFDGDCTKVTAVPSYAEVASSFFTTFCVECHSSTKVGAARNGATDGIDFDSYDHAAAAALPGVAMVKGRRMPFPDGAGPTNAERNLFYEWALCGTPK